MNKFVKGYTFDDVLIIPDYSDIDSRSIPDVTTKLTNEINLAAPIIASCMDTVTEYRMARVMHYFGGLGILHRFAPTKDRVEWVYRLARYKDAGQLIATAIGVSSEERAIAEQLVGTGADILVVDVAHGDSSYCLAMVEWLKSKFPTLTVIAGNVATANGTIRLQEAGADAIRVGIGPGAACTTRIVTGVGVPQLTAIMDCSEVATVPIIADGGIKSSADFAKAIAAGASAVMCGSILAGSDESPGEKVRQPDGHYYKEYRGMASKHAQIDRHQGNVDEASIVAEGAAGLVRYTGPVSNTIQQMVGGLKSSMSYVNARNISEFQYKAEFMEVTSFTVQENKPHGVLWAKS